MRPKRILQAGATYDVATKTDHDAMALHGAEIKQMLLGLVEKAKKKFGFELFNFTVMDNYIHFLIKPGEDASLSEIMQWIKCNFAKMWNKKHNTKGHLWGERFSSRIIRDEEDFAATSDHIDNIPVEAKLVRKAEDWKFGGLFRKIRGITGLVDRAPEDGLFFPATAPPVFPPAPG
jgi:putative transposase